MSLRHLWRWNTEEEVGKCEGEKRTAFMWGRSAEDDYCEGCNAVLTLAHYHDIFTPMTTDDEVLRRLDRIEGFVRGILGQKS